MRRSESLSPPKIFEKNGMWMRYAAWNELKLPSSCRSRETLSCPIVRVSDTEYFLALEDMKVGEGFLKQCGHLVCWGKLSSDGSQDTYETCRTNGILNSEQKDFNDRQSLLLWMCWISVMRVGGTVWQQSCSQQFSTFATLTCGHTHSTSCCDMSEQGTAQLYFIL